MKFSSLAPLSAVLLLASCAVGPDYKRPEAGAPVAFKEGEGIWKPAQPSDGILRGEWWALFGDETLDGLEQDTAANSQQVAASLARVEQARAIAGIVKSDFYPKISANPEVTRNRFSLTSPAYNPGVGQYFTDIQLPLDLEYELDLWGKIRRKAEAASGSVRATEAEHAAVLLLVQTEVARNYFLLRTLDEEIAVVGQMVESREKSLRLMLEKRAAQLESDFNVSRAQTELSTTKVRCADLVGKRGRLEHALAVLLGKAPANFSLKANPLMAKPDGNDDIILPEIPVGTPSDLLQRRPDIAEAERRVMAANAQIGVATAAFFPSIKIFGLAGFESVDSSVLFDSASKWWSIGPSLHLPIFEGGQNISNLNRSEAAYLETVANYRQTALQAFSEVEDTLLGLKILKEQYADLKKASVSADHALGLAHSQYREGIISYLDVITTEDSALNIRQQRVQVLGQRYAATVLLIKALGGGWDDKSD
ncbi:MAG: efflux transporter outer membrane subunit [Verrucomicrobiales bacterium]|jgi:multidrug efflux system outer membrane protein|nr:efflux transporter outer membrane subunit [Verrucomicrobiales bacterium]